jgi:hypothetical membrane protein
MAPEPRSQPAVPSARAVLIGAVFWILTLEFFGGQGVAQAAWRTPYSLLTNSISDLGNTACGTWPPASVNLKSLGLSATYICSPRHAVMNASFIVAGVLILLGAYLTRSQWPRRRLTSWGVALLMAAGVGKIIVGLVPENTVVLLHLLGSLGIFCAVIGIHDYGLAERLLDYPTFAWLALMGLVFIRACRSRPAGATVDPSGRAVKPSQRA